MRLHLLLLLLTLTLAVGGCRSARTNIRGSGAAVSDVRPVAGFTSVTFALPASLVVEQGGADRVTIEGDDNIVPEVRTEVLNGDLIIVAQRSYITPRASTPVVVRVTGKAIDTVNITGVGEARVTGITGPTLKLTLGGPAQLSADGLNVDQLAISLGDTGRVTVAGRAARQEATVGGSTVYAADGLDSRAASLEVSDAARAIVRVSDTLNATVRNGGTVEYIGAPTVTQRVIGSGEVKPYAP